MRNLILSICFSVSCLCSSAQTQLVTNGEFTTDLSNWTASGNVLYNNFYSNGSLAFSGGNTPVTGVISQNITVAEGETLTITLTYARRGSTGSTVAGLFEIIDNTTSLTVSSTTLTAPDTDGTFITTTFTFVAPSSSLKIRFTDQTLDTMDKDFYFNTISIESSLLPIKLLNFNPDLIDDGHVKLSWQTASETNNDYFTIERSINGVEWETVTRINGAGNSSILLNYSTIDNNPYHGVSYYRLKQTDFDGEIEYSKIKSVNLQNQISEVSIYPNPVNTELTIEGNSAELEGIVIYNMSGQNVTARTQQTRINETRMAIDLSQLAVGIYYIKTKTDVYKVYRK